jgi:Mg2+ and Co2+ transporter CorA
MSDQIKKDVERIKQSADKIAGHAASQIHAAFATSINLLAENFEKLEKAIDKDRSK